MAEQAAPVGSTVHVLTYVHRHGTDLTAHTTWEAALAEKASIARDGWEGLRERVGDEVPAQPPEDDMEAAEAYFTRGEEEAFINSLTVQA